MAFLYWIHLPEHTDITKDGYIGVTKDEKKRFKHHCGKHASRRMREAWEIRKQI